MKAYLYVRVSAADRDTTPEAELERLHAAVARKDGWSSGGEYLDVAPEISGPRPGLEDLLRAVWRHRRGEAGVGVSIVTNGLWRLFRSPRRLAELGGRLWAHGVELVALDEDLDTTRLHDRFRWEAAIGLLSEMAHRQRSEAVKVGLARRGRRSGQGAIRPAAIINPLELKLAFEGTEKKRPLPISKIGPSLDVSETTARKYIRLYIEQGTLDPAARARHLAKAGGQRKGGRPRNAPVDVERLIDLWHKGASLRAMARELGVSRATVAKELGKQRSAGRINDELREELLSRRKPAR